MVTDTIYLVSQASLDTTELIAHESVLSHYLFKFFPHFLKMHFKPFLPCQDKEGDSLFHNQITNRLLIIVLLLLLLLLLLVFKLYT